jgi:signal transduction histidine kinase
VNDYLPSQFRQELAEQKRTEMALRESQSQLEEALAREKQRRQLSDTLREVASIVNNSLDQQQVLDSILTQLEKVVIYHRASVTLLDGDELTFIGGRNEAGRVTGKFTIPAKRYILNKITLEEKQPLLIPDVRYDDRWQSIGEHSVIRSFINAPLLIQNRPIGLLGVGRSDDVPYTEDDSQTVFAFALQVAIAVENSRLYAVAQREITERKKAELVIQFAKAELDERTQELEEQAIELAKAEAALKVAHDELVKINADKDKFFSILAHDLKSPFMPVLAHAELLADPDETFSPEEIRIMTTSIHRSAKRVIDLLENLLQWSRIQMGRMEYLPGQVDLAKVIQQNVQLIMEQATNKNILLYNGLRTGLFVWADENMLDTVIRNLVSNAVKFTAIGGRVEVTAQIGSSVKQPVIEPVETPCVEISVSDTGVGISSENVDKLFKIGTHYSTEGTAHERGTGLGLILCNEMVRLNGGQIGVESELGKGTTFRFTVPLDEVRPEYSPSSPARPDNRIMYETFDAGLIAPPSEIVTILFDLAMSGDMQGIMKQATQLESMDERYIPLARKLQELAQIFDEDAILALIERFIKGVQ